MRLVNKVALITGSGRGIGKVTAETFAREGAMVIVSDVAAEFVEEVVNEIRATDGQAVGKVCNITNRQQVKAMVEEVLAEFNKIDILINNAGITRDARLVKMSEADWDAVIDVNLKGVFNATQLVAPVMIEAGYGHIINAASVVGLYGNFGQTNYVATKAGVIGMTKVWARELGPKGITVNAIAPGFIATEMIKTVPEKVQQAIVEKTPLRRLGNAQDIANAYLFLASEEASFINGHCLSVDGGLIL